MARGPAAGAADGSALFVVAVMVLAAGGGWFWTQRLQAAPVKTATVTAISGPARRAAPC